MITLRLIASAAIVAAGSLSYAYRERARHLAVPVLADPSSPASTLAQEIASAPPCVIRPLIAGGARLDGRVTAIAVATDGVIWAGTLQGGIRRVDPRGELTPVRLAGRQRFITALAATAEHVYAATYAGLLSCTRDGDRCDALFPEAFESAIQTDGGRVIAGSARGLVIVDSAGGRRVAITGPYGESIRASALAWSRDGNALWVGSPRGAWALPRSVLLGASATAIWHPLVFGQGAADSNVVTAIAPLATGAVAGTDSAGLAFVDGAGVFAHRFAEPRANEVNPGAMVRLGDAVWVGTQGGGLLRITQNSSTRATSIARPAGFPVRRVSAIATAQPCQLCALAGQELIIGTDEGELFAATCS